MEEEKQLSCTIFNCLSTSILLNIVGFQSTDNEPHFFDYKTEFFSFQNNPKNLDLSYKTVLDLWECLGRVQLVLQQNFIIKD